MTRRKREYLDYINGSQWRAKRREALLFYGAWCAKCGADNRELHVHHLTYRNFGREELSDLQVLCHVCHMALHAKKQPARKPKLVAANGKQSKRLKKRKRKQPKDTNGWLANYRAQVQRKLVRQGASR